MLCIQQENVTSATGYNPNATVVTSSPLIQQGGYVFEEVASLCS